MNFRGIISYNLYNSNLWFSTSVQDNCQTIYTLRHAASEGLATTCEVLNGTYGLENIHSCMTSACAAGANAFNWDPEKKSCFARKCEDLTDLLLSNEYGGRDIYVAEGKWNRLLFV